MAVSAGVAGNGRKKTTQRTGGIVAPVRIAALYATKGMNGKKRFAAAVPTPQGEAASTTILATALPVRIATTRYWYVKSVAKKAGFDSAYIRR